MTGDDDRWLPRLTQYDRWRRQMTIKACILWQVKMTDDCQSLHSMTGDDDKWLSVLTYYDMWRWQMTVKAYIVWQVTMTDNCQGLHSMTGDDDRCLSRPTQYDMWRWQMPVKAYTVWQVTMTRWLSGLSLLHGGYTKGWDGILPSCLSARRHHSKYLPRLTPWQLICCWPGWSNVKSFVVHSALYISFLVSVVLIFALISIPSFYSAQVAPCL